MPTGAKTAYQNLYYSFIEKLITQGIKLIECVKY